MIYPEVDFYTKYFVRSHFKDAVSTISYYTL